MSKENLEKLDIQYSDSKTYIVERVEDGICHIEIVENEEVIGNDLVKKDMLPDGIHDGAVLDIENTDSELQISIDYYQSAVRQKQTRDIVREYSESLGEYTKNK